MTWGRQDSTISSISSPDRYVEDLILLTIAANSPRESCATDSQFEISSATGQIQKLVPLWRGHRRVA